MDKIKIRKKLDSLAYKGAYNKVFYSFNDLFKDFKLTNYEKCFDIIQDLKDELYDISFPINFVMQYKRKEDLVYDIYLSNVGVFLIFASLAKYLDKEEEKNLCYLISKVIYKQDYIFYPERRLLYRQDYTETTKYLRSRVKRIYENDDYFTISERLNTLYHTILSSYYYVENATELCLIKLGTTSKNYLDYISLRELKDLQEIQDRMLFELTNARNTDYLQIARHAALEKRTKFINDYKVSPLQYRTHNNKPLSMVKKFNKLRKKLNIDELSLAENIEIFEK